jgi:Spy/CpxP family protein refolding chaperone
MKSTVKLLFTLLTLGIAAAAPLAHAKEKPEKVAHAGQRLKGAVDEHDKMLNEKLKLTAEQQAKLATIRKEQAAGMKANRGDRAKMADAMKTGREQIRAMLTAEQQTTFDSIKPEGREAKQRKKGKKEDAS